MRHDLRIYLFCTVASAAAAGAAPPAFAQAEPSAATPRAEGGAVGELVVTAQKRSERLSNVGLTITALSGDQLARQGVSDTSDLVKDLPGFTFAQGTYGAPI